MKNKHTRMISIITAMFMLLTVFVMPVTVFANGSIVGDLVGELKKPIIENDSTMKAKQRVTYDCIYFGNYPQSEITEDDYIYTQLANSDKWEGEYLVLDGNKYERTEKTSNGITEYRYFKFEPIKWRVLEITGNKAVLLSDLILDKKQFHKIGNDILGYPSRGSDWPGSTIRSWLNGYDSTQNYVSQDYTSDNFIGKAFSDKEQASIYKTLLNNNYADGYKINYSAQATEDYIYLMSASEICDGAEASIRGFTPKENDESRRGENSEYNESKYNYDGELSEWYTCKWWTRCSDAEFDGAICVMSDGGFLGGRVGEESAITIAEDINVSLGVRPALTLDLSSSEWKYAGTVCTDGTIVEANEDIVIDRKYITGNDLFGEYAKYLNNKAYRDMCGEIRNQVELILWQRSDKSIGWSGFKKSLENGAINNLKSLYGSLTGKFSHERELEQEIAQDLVRRIGQDKTVIGKVSGDVREGFGWIEGSNSFLETVLENGFKNEQSKIKAAKVLSGGLFDDSDAYRLIKSVEKNMDSFGKVASVVGDTIDVVDIAFNIALSMETNYETTMRLKTGVGGRNDSALHRGLTSLENIQRKTVKENAWDEYFEYAMDAIAEALLDIASGAIAPVEFTMKFIGVHMKNPDIDVLNKLAITTSNSEVLFAEKTDVITSIILNYRDNGMAASDDIKDIYEVLCVAHFESIKQSVEYALEVATPTQKEALQKTYNKYEKYLTYDKYLESCVVNANMEWKYKISDGEAQIVGVSIVNEPANDEITPSKTDFTSNDVIVDIPEEIDGLKVVEIGDSVFKDNDDIACVSVSENVKKIGNYSFEDCDSLHTVFLNDNLSTVGNATFSGCTQLADIAMPYAVQNIGDDVFAGITDITIKVVDSSVAHKYAESISNATFENVEMKAVEISIVSEPDKMSYKMSEAIDSSGIKVVATMEDGSEKDVSDEVYCEFEDKQVGTNKVNVYYDNVSTCYMVDVTADNCEYTIRYLNKYGEELSAPVSRTAMAGEEISLEIKDIDGYIPETTNKTVIIGEFNEFEVYYTAEPAIDIETAVVTDISDQMYTGQQIKPTVTVSYEGNILTEGTDFYFEYGENVNVGDGQVVVIGIGNYTGLINKNFYIIESYKDISAATVKLAYANYKYTGKQIKPEPIVTIDGEKLVEYVHYTVSYGVNKWPGVGTVTITGMGEYEGAVTKQFTIAKVTGLKVKATGTDHIKLSWNKQANVKGYKVYRLKDGKYKLVKTVKGSNNNYCTIKNLGAGNGYTFKVRSYAGNKPYLSVYSEALSAPTKPAKVVMKKLTTGKTHFVKAFWGKKNGTGYQVMIATNPKFTKGKKIYKITSNKTLSKKITGLKKGKTYYVKVRAYKTFGGKTKYGQWSKYKKIRCK